ncbi:hypothetical protein NG798_26000 [Ancylothrix sp. C2]|uniref:hypothetical protein n=1 Tax=Ancylothrix sp. D3o TaxID=2953691 RepID=UPI0021BA8CAB|nr:hypothetical protein [Ancylothrix sp. D3o]MCT7953256.1 hypothetical protein [Ancylothrix sp. D3o]
MNTATFWLTVILIFFPIAVVVLLIAVLPFWIYIFARLAFNLMCRAIIYMFIAELMIGIITIPISLWLLKKLKESNFMNNYFSLDYHEFLVYKWGMSVYQMSVYQWIQRDRNQTSSAE